MAGQVQVALPATALRGKAYSIDLNSNEGLVYDNTNLVNVGDLVNANVRYKTSPLFTWLTLKFSTIPTRTACTYCKGYTVPSTAWH